MSRPCRRRLTRTGWTFLVAGVVLVSTRAWPGALVPVAGTAVLGMVALAAVAVAWQWSVRLGAVSAQWRLPRLVPARDEVPVAALVSSSEAMPPLALSAWDVRTRRFQPVVRLAGLDAASVRPGWTVRFPRRGLVALPPLRLSCRLPFGLVRIDQEGGDPAEVVVLPHRGRLRRAARERIDTFAASGSEARLPDGDDLAHLRPYRPGDRPQAIHWRATARLGTLLVAERQAAVGRQVSIALDCRPGASLERRISLAAAILDHLATQGAQGILHLPDRVVPPPLTQQQEALALVQALATPPGAWLPPAAVVVSDDWPDLPPHLVLGSASLVEGA